MPILILDIWQGWVTQRNRREPHRVPGNFVGGTTIVAYMKCAIVSAVALAGCNWVSLGANAVTYETLAPGDAGNIVVAESRAYVTLGDSGIAVLDARSGRRTAVIPPPDGLQSVDDLAVADGLLFALDARKPGALATLRLPDGRSASPAHPVSVGPFSGVSAAGGRAVVSGGTSRLSAWRYDAHGSLALLDSADLGRGQPDVTLDSAGRRAFVPTHYWGPYFGLNVLELTPRIREVARIEIEGAGFTTGGAKPANFPFDVAQLNDRVTLVAHARGIAVVDVVTASLVRVIDVGGPAVALDVKESEAAVAIAGRAPGLILLRFGASGERIVRRVTFEPGTKPAGVAFSGNIVLVAARDRGVLVVQH